MTSPTTLDHWLHRISVPTLIVWGDKDGVLPVGRAKAWMDHLPKGAELRILKDIGHLTFDESPEGVKVAQDFMLKAEAR